MHVANELCRTNLYIFYLKHSIIDNVFINFDSLIYCLKKGETNTRNVASHVT